MQVPGATAKEVQEVTLARAQGRVLSIDALRGFDMFWIVGGASLVRELSNATGLPFLQSLAVQFTHVQWEGLRAYDVIFPLFLFIVGTSLPFAFARRLERRDSRGRILGHVLRRVVILIFFGMWINGNLLTYDPSRFQITYSVLQAISLGYLVASVVYLTAGIRGQAIAIAAFTLGYFLLMKFVPVPGYGAGVITPEGNFGRWLNDLVLGDLQGRWRFGWIIQIPTWGATALLGVMAGHLLRSRLSQMRKLAYLAGAGAGCVLTGLLWSIWLPIIKNLWTSSYLFVCCGISLLLLACFYLLVDIWKKERWVFPFRVIGMNAIAIYVAWNIFDFRHVARVFVRGLSQYVGPWYGFAERAGAFVVAWLILYHLYRRKIFFRV